MLHIWLLFVNVFKLFEVIIIMIYFLYSIIMDCNFLALN